MVGDAILWRCLDKSGHEYARLSQERHEWQLRGVTVFLHDQQPCILEYMVLCDRSWTTRYGRITGCIGDRNIDVEVTVDTGGKWHLNGTPCPNVNGSSDLDLNFSPSTNLLPIRRLNLAVGESGEAKAAWLLFPDFTLQPLEQTYRRIDRVTYRYETVDGIFSTELKVNSVGFVTLYPDLWIAEAVLNGR